MEIKNNVLVKVDDSDIKNGTFIIPSNVIAIGEYAFEACKSLKNITIQSSITKIGRGAFRNCKSLKNITLPDSITAVDFDTFSGCIYLENIIIPNSVTEIGKDAFHDCESLKNITLPNSVKIISDSAFYGCKSLENITIPDCVKTISHSAFNGCKSLKNINFPNSLEYIGDRAFGGCKNLEDVIIPNGVREIGDGAFYGCTYLNNVIISDSVRHTKGFTFCNCIFLKNIDFSSSLTNIQQSDFDFQTSLQNIIVYGQKVNMKIFTFDEELNVVRQKELLDKIIFYLVSRGILDKRHYKYAKHKEFINTTIEKYKSNQYYYEDDFNKYMEEYINRNNLKKEDGQIDSNLKTLNDNVTNHNVKEFNPNGSISIINYGDELLENISKIEELISMIPTNYGPTNTFLEEELEKFKNPRNIIQYIESSKSDENVYLGKNSINLLMYCTAYNIYRLNVGIQKLSELQKILKIYIEKINHYKDNLLNYKVISIDTKDLHKNDDILIQSKINKKVGSYDNHLILVTDLYKKLERK